jgi:predicted transcriptional regulator
MEDSDDGMLLNFAINHQRNAVIQRKRQRRVWIYETIQLREELGKFKRLIQELNLDAVRFRQYFRMTPHVFEELIRV